MPQASPFDTLFSPFRVKSLELPNRFVMAPMGRLFGDADNVPSDDYVDYFRRRVEGGVSLTISEATGISPNAAVHKTSPNFYGSHRLEQWRKVVVAVHKAGGCFMPQLWHAGFARVAEQSAHPDLPSVSPSDWYIPDTDAQLNRKPGIRIGSPMTMADIEAVVADYGEAASAAQAIGCDGVEIHGAHGYLIDQFLWSDANLRTDAFGGDFAGRTRFAVEVVKEIRRRTGPDFPILFRFSQWKIQDYNARIANNPAELEQIVTPLADAGVDIFHCSTRRFWDPEFEGSDLNLAGWTKKLTGMPTITVGSVGLDTAFGVGSDDGSSYSDNLASSKGEAEALDVARPDGIDRLLNMFARGDFDLIALGRAVIANPDWPNLIRQGAHDRLRPYSRDLLLKLI